MAGPGPRPWRRELLSNPMAGPWQGPGRAAAPAPPPRDHFPAGFYHAGNRDLASTKAQKPRITKSFPSCRGTGTALPGTSRAAWQQRAVPRHRDTRRPSPCGTPGAWRGGDSPVATWDRAGRPGSAGSAPYLPKSCLHKRRSRSGLAPGGHRAEMPRGTASTQGRSVVPGPPGRAVPTQLAPLPGWRGTQHPVCQDG